MKAFKAFCHRQLAHLIEAEACWLEWPEPPIDYPGHLVEQVRDRAARLGLVDLAIAPTDASLDEARLYLAKAIAYKVDGSSGDLSVEQAANLLGCKPKTVRSLIERTRRGLPGGIQYRQASRHSPIHFRREWIDAFIAEHSHGRKKTARADPLTYDEF